MKLELSFHKRNLLEEETLTSLDSTCLRKSRYSANGPDSRRLFSSMALEKGKASFVDKETKAQIIGMTLLQLLGIQRQVDRDGGQRPWG